MKDKEIEIEICRIEREIEKWARSRDLWDDCNFRNFIDFQDAEPWKDYPVVTILTFDGEFSRVFDGSLENLYEEFSSLLERNGYWFERDIGRVYVLSAREDINNVFKEYFHWQWICSLLKPDFNDIHHELFARFARPEDLLKLKWRDFEILIYEILRKQGFGVELGPGRGDGGIDLTLIQKDPIGDILTAVQVKRFRSDRKIDLQAVQALHGAAVANEMAKSAFVTTSDYLPSSRSFAGRENVAMDLYTSTDVIRWCNQTSNGIIKEKESLVSKESLAKVLGKAMKKPRHYVVHANVGETMRMNAFAVILKESKHAALLMGLPSRTVSHDGYETRGLEVPVIDPLSLHSQGTGRIFRVKKKGHNDPSCHFWDGSNIYSPWMEEPQNFDYMD